MTADTTKNRKLKRQISAPVKAGLLGLCTIWLSAITNAGSATTAKESLTDALTICSGWVQADEIFDSPEQQYDFEQIWVASQGTQDRREIVRLYPDITMSTLSFYHPEYTVILRLSELKDKSRECSISGLDTSAKAIAKSADKIGEVVVSAETVSAAIQDWAASAVAKQFTKLESNTASEPNSLGAFIGCQNESVINLTATAPQDKATANLFSWIIKLDLQTASKHDNQHCM